MTFKLLTFMCLVAAVLSANVTLDELPSQPPPSEPIAVEPIPEIPDKPVPTTTTTVTPSPSPPTASPTTSTTTTTTTPKPTTTTTTTTTPAPAPPTTTTTVAPTPTTTIKPSPRPGPVPDADFGIWNFHDSTQNKTCIIVQLALQLNLTYNTNENKQLNVLYNVPAKDVTVIDGACGNASDSITLQWQKQNNITLNFAKNDTVGRFELTQLHFNINASSVFADAKSDQIIDLINNQTLFSTLNQHSYYCSRAQLLNLTTTKSNETVASLKISHVQLEAFHQHNDASFSTAKDCDAIDTPDIVPIAVGCALAALVVVVLIAYLVSRRRSQTRGYLSM